MSRRDVRITVCQRHLASGVAERPEVPVALRAIGLDVHEIDDGPIEWTGDDREVLWIQGNANWYPRICARLEQTPIDRRPLVVLWHTEPLPPPPGSGLPPPRLHLREIAKIVLRDRRATDVYTNAARLRRLARFGLPDLLVTSARIRQQYLAACAIESHFIPLGYHEASHGRDLGLDRDIDVLFLGTTQVPRRRRLVTQLRNAGVNLRTAGSWYDPMAWGEERTRLLNRTKILLSLLRHAGEFSGLRMILGMCNGAMIVSEPIAASEPYAPGRHYVEARAEEMPHVIRHYLEHPHERKRITDEAYRLVTQDLPLRRAVQCILDLLDEKFVVRAEKVVP